MLYESEWLSLLDMRERLKARGHEAAEAESAICLALPDMRLRRWAIAKVTYAPTGGTLAPAQVRGIEFTEGIKLKLAIPYDLKRDDIDWDNSRPKRPWPYGPWQHQLLAHVARIEVSRKNFDKAFPLRAPAAETTSAAAEEAQPIASEPDRPRGEIVDEPISDNSPAAPAKGNAAKAVKKSRRKKKTRGKKRATKLERARRAISEIYGLDGVSSEKTDAELFDEVCRHLGADLDDISLDTVRRAAGRRK